MQRLQKRKFRTSKFFLQSDQDPDKSENCPARKPNREILLPPITQWTPWKVDDIKAWKWVKVFRRKSSLDTLDANKLEAMELWEHLALMGEGFMISAIPMIHHLAPPKAGSESFVNIKSVLLALSLVVFESSVATFKKTGNWAALVEVATGLQLPVVWFLKKKKLISKDQLQSVCTATT
ncbi:hypothetical protein BDN67DRAFT_983615 [Paxillus ammoniavirescens]|nr:hypothetical protein BDN67DRAFT_983615 [Paxillus ammoniavirescens]